MSREQALVYGSRLLKGEQLFQSVQSVWNDESNHLAMSRAFAGHHQIVLSIIHHNGDNKYLVEKGGLSFGTRTSYVPDHEGKGVVPVPIAPSSEGETTQGSFLNERSSRNLKYELPAVKDLDKFHLDSYMVKRLYDLLNFDDVPADLKSVWDDLIQQADTDTDNEDDENSGCFECKESDEESTVTICSNESRSVTSMVINGWEQLSENENDDLDDMSLGGSSIDTYST